MRCASPHGSSGEAKGPAVSRARSCICPRICVCIARCVAHLPHSFLGQWHVGALPPVSHLWSQSAAKIGKTTRIRTNRTSRNPPSLIFGTRDFVLGLALQSRVG